MKFLPRGRERPGRPLPEDFASIPVYYINLDHRQDRRQLSESLWRNQLSMRSVTRIAGVADPVGYRGCTKAHLRAVEGALDSRADDPFVLLAEDDVTMLPVCKPEELARTVFEALQRLPRLNVLFLTASLHRYRLTEVEGVVRLKRKGALAMPAQIVFRDYLEQLRDLYLAALIADKPHDRLTSKVQGRDHWYALDPPLMRQAAGYSDIEQRYVDYGPENR